MALDVHIVSREKDLWEGEATSVSAPSISGSVGILPGRQPLLAGLTAGKVTVKNGSDVVFSVDVEDGFISVDSDRVIVGLDHAGSSAEMEKVSEDLREK